MKRVDFFTIDSTNEEAKRRIRAGEVFDTVITARAQTAGRGRRGRGFYSPDTGDSVYMSFILRPQERQRTLQLLTVAAAVAVCRAIEEMDCGSAPAMTPPSRPAIKWVNDILIDEKKVCGILAEYVMPSPFVVLGIGININIPERDFPAELRDRAGSLWRPPDGRENLIEAVCSNMSCAYTGTLNEQDAGIISAYRSYENTTGRRVLVTKYTGTNVIPAFAKAISPDGGLVVIYEDGSEEILRSGEVSVTPQS